MAQNLTDVPVLLQRRDSRGSGDGPRRTSGLEVKTEDGNGLGEDGKSEKDLTAQGEGHETVSESPENTSAMICMLTSQRGDGEDDGYDSTNPIPWTVKWISLAAVMCMPIGASVNSLNYDDAYKHRCQLGGFCSGSTSKHAAE